ncbi:MAG: succinate dehydrogenase assembly factor 2 [Alphaproteobacteria bacterium]
MTEQTDAATVRRKRIRFRCWHRGTREMDLLLGGFADRHIALLSVSDLDALETLLDCPDPEIYGWVTGHRGEPAGVSAGLLAHLKADIESASRIR